MPAGSSHLQASLSLTLEFSANPTNSLRKPVSEIMFHLTWTFLEPDSVTLLLVAAPVLSCYRKLCAQASSLTSVEIHRIRTPLNHRTPTSSIWSHQAHNVSKLLLLYYFRLGGMIFCLETYKRATSSTLHQSMHVFFLSLISPSTQGNPCTTSLRCDTCYTRTSLPNLHYEAP